MLTERLTDPQLYCLMAGILALGCAGLLMVTVWPIRKWPFDGGMR